jgi:hypothetical protein
MFVLGLTISCMTGWKQILDGFLWNNMIFACSGGEPQHYLHPDSYIRVMLVDGEVPQIQLAPMGNGVLPRE